VAGLPDRKDENQQREKAGGYGEEAHACSLGAAYERPVRVL
jgi:hypothetical protein